MKLTAVRGIGIIGAGNMGTALIAGLLKAGVVGKADLCASDLSAQRCSNVFETYGIKCFSSNKELVSKSNIIIIAVEPSHVKAVLMEIRETLTNQLLISIAAGITINYLLRYLPKTVPIIRAMPNNPCLAGEGMTVLSSSARVSKERLRAAEKIFASVGRVMILDERFFDAVTGLSGSGPAYIYRVIEGLVEGGVRAGLNEETALTLVAQTVLGAGKMVLKSNMHPVKLRQMVATPGGTTVEGLKELERSNIKASFIKAVERAAERSRELVRMLNEEIER